MKKFLAILASAFILFTLVCCGKKSQTVSNDIQDSPHGNTEKVSQATEGIKTEDKTDISNAAQEMKTEDKADTSNAAQENSAGNTVDPDLKAFLDEYETFMDEYMAFMKKYNESDNVMEMLSDYSSLMQRYSDFAEAINQYDTDEMSATDAAYYLEVVNRVNLKLLEAVN